MKVTKISRQIKILSEIEKVWILYDLDGNSSLDVDEIIKYLEERAYPHLSLTQDQLRVMFQSID